jgi:3-deoxy-manno-octulosonate cytidylyltransferase (CMP-KDO synthetase)
MLADLRGKPVLRHVWERAMRVRNAAEVVVLTEHEKVRSAVESWGGTCLLTPESCSTGTERIASALDRLSGDCICNLQGDEPFLNVPLIERMVELAGRDEFLTPVYPITDPSWLHTPNVVKVVRDHRGRALYFSRHPIPYVRDLPPERWCERVTYYGHMGVYLYRRELLEKLPQLPPSPLAEAESLEQLRFLQSGYAIQTIETSRPGPAVDTREDLAQACDYAAATE